MRLESGERLKAPRGCSMGDTTHQAGLSSCGRGDLVPLNVPSGHFLSHLPLTLLPAQTLRTGLWMCRADTKESSSWRREKEKQTGGWRRASFSTDVQNESCHSKSAPQPSTSASCPHTDQKGACYRWLRGLWHCPRAPAEPAWMERIHLVHVGSETWPPPCPQPTF